MALQGEGALKQAQLQKRIALVHQVVGALVCQGARHLVLGSLSRQEQGQLQVCGGVALGRREPHAGGSGHVSTAWPLVQACSSLPHAAHLALLVVPHTGCSGHVSTAWPLALACSSLPHAAHLHCLWCLTLAAGPHAASGQRE